jgi:hypothetical protein
MPDDTESKEASQMADAALPVGPVEIAVVGFAENAPDERVGAAVARSVADRAIRVLDALVVRKDGDGTVTIVDVEREGDAPELLGIPTALPGLLSGSDAERVAQGLPDATTAVILAWEDTWAVRLRAALAEAGGVIARQERIDAEDLAAVLETFAVTKLLDDQLGVDAEDNAVVEEDLAAESVEEK